VIYRSILITGGAGFVGSNLAIWFKTHYAGIRVVAVDNLRRRGAELNLPRLKVHDVEFVHGDVRNSEDLRLDKLEPGLIIECSAEPSVLAGYADAPDYLVNTNLGGTLTCLELARRTRADFIFLSTSRVYPIASLNALPVSENATRFVLATRQETRGVSPLGISEDFPLEGARTLYGTSKLCSELLIEEYADICGIRYVINRCGVIAGPWQMGKIDQGIFAFWMAQHYFGQALRYIGWGGEGKQVRDLLDIDDLAELLNSELLQFGSVNGRTFNVGGGSLSSLSLRETTSLCEEITGRRLRIEAEAENRPGDVRLFISDTTRVTEATGWRPRRSPRETLASIFEWIRREERLVRTLWT
jgi:CDP-paratose 2-epimerase